MEPGHHTLAPLRMAVPRPNFTEHGHTGVLVGNADAPSFLNFGAALSTFSYQAPHNSAVGRPDLWRVVQPYREAWLRRTTITPDTMAVLVEGHQVAGTVLEPSTPAGHRSQELKDSGGFTFDRNHRWPSVESDFSLDAGPIVPAWHPRSR